MMAKRATPYPQVEIGAAGLVNASLVPVPASVSIAEALATSRRRNVQGLVAGDAVILREDLARAASLGVGGARVRALARPLPVVESRATEVVVRRHLAAGAPLVVVRDGRRVLGGVRPSGSAVPGIAVADRLARRLSDATRDVLATAARIAAERGARAYLAGGVVRDALAGRRDLGSPDLDLVVEGDGPGVARALADALAAPVIEHARFLTATVGPTSAGRVDVATARSERYEGRGTLPRVMPSSIDQDLRRRDFTVNAMAVELVSGAFGLLDPHGGRADLAGGRLRVLHPASFVEDPTRIFRAARYAARLGLRPDAWTAGCQAWALSLVPYPALSGPRILAELARILAERSPEIALVRLGVAGAFRLLDPRYRFRRLTRARIAALPSALAWTRAHALDVAPVELLLVALLCEQEAAIVSSALRRLDFSGDPLARLTRAISEAPALADAVLRAARESARARVLRGRSALELGALALGGPETVRQHVAWFGEAGRTRAALKGDDVIALGVPAGPSVAAVLEALRDARLDGDVRARSDEEAFVRRWTRDGSDGRSSRKER
jgi:tRNA nucleotidyltransferase (CCA-adding enzyme)